MKNPAIKNITGKRRYFLLIKMRKTPLVKQKLSLLLFQQSYRSLLVQIYSEASGSGLIPAISTFTLC